MITNVPLLGPLNGDTAVTDISNTDVAILVICTEYGVILETPVGFADDCYELGEIISYEVKIKNTGNLTKNNIAIRDNDNPDFGRIFFTDEDPNTPLTLKPLESNTTKYIGWHEITAEDIALKYIVLQGISEAQDIDGADQEDLSDFDNYE